VISCARGVPDRADDGLHELVDLDDDGRPQDDDGPAAAGRSGQLPAPVSATVEHASAVPGAEGLSLRAGTGGSSSFVLDVDCSAVRPPTDACSGGQTPPLATDVLRLAVTADGAARAERDHLLPDTGWGGLGEQLAHTCSAHALGVDVARRADDGSWTPSRTPRPRASGWPGRSP